MRSLARKKHVDAFAALLKFRLPVMLARGLARGTKKALFQPSPEAPLRFLVIKLDGAGDVVLTTPVFRALREAFPNSSCVAVVQARNRALLAHNPFITEVLSPPEIAGKGRAFHRAWGMVRFFRQSLSHRRFDVVIHPRYFADIYHGTLLVSLVPAVLKIGYSDSTSVWKHTLNKGLERSYTYVVQPFETTHEVFRNLHSIEALTGRVADPEIDVFSSEAEKVVVADLVRHAPDGALRIGIAIGAASPQRVWPVGRWAETLGILSRTRPCFVFVLCVKADGAKARELLEVWGGEGLAVDNTTWSQAAALLNDLDLFLGNDSGMGHVAAAAGIPVVVVSPHLPSSEDPAPEGTAGFEPFGPEVRMLKPTHRVEPCSEECVAAEPHCILQIYPEQVAAAAGELIGNTYSPRTVQPHPHG